MRKEIQCVCVWVCVCVCVCVRVCVCVCGGGWGPLTFFKRGISLKTKKGKEAWLWPALTHRINSLQCVCVYVCACFIRSFVFDFSECCTSCSVCACVSLTAWMHVVVYKCVSVYDSIISCVSTLLEIWEWEWDLLSRYIYTYEEFVIVTEAPQCNRMTVTGQDTDNKRIIYK